MLKGTKQSTKLLIIYAYLLCYIISFEFGGDLNCVVKFSMLVTKYLLA